MTMAGALGATELFAGIAAVVAGGILLIMGSTALRSIRRDMEDEGRAKSGRLLTPPEVWRKLGNFENVGGMGSRIGWLRMNYWAGLALLLVGFGLVLFRPG